MQTQHRNILIIAVVAVLLVCCCCAVTISLVVPVRSILGLGGHRSESPTSAPAIATPHAFAESTAELHEATSPSLPAPGTSTAPSPKETPSPVSTSSAQAVAPEAPTEAATTVATTSVDSEIAQAEVEMPARDLRALALKLKPGLTDIPIVVNQTPPTYRVGDTAEFWVSNSDTMEHRKITAKLDYINDRVKVWVEQGIDLSLADLEKSADRFANKTYPTDREFFGSEWTPGVDDDVRLNILHAVGLGEGTAGYYSSADEFSRKVNPYSNEKEMFYVSAASESARPNSSYYDGTLAHEFQHMIHWHNDPNEESWVTEGMSELATFLNGFDPGGFDIAYGEHPDTQLTTWADQSVGNAEHYGASYLFMSYFLDRFGEDLTKAVVASPKNGIAGFNDALEKAGRPERFDDIFADWLIANYVDRPDLNGGRYGYKEIDPYRPVTVESYGRYPVSGQAQVSQYGVEYIKLGGGGPVTIDFQGQQQVKMVDAPNDTGSSTRPRGTYSWWSNRGDDADSTLTRAFDLRGLDSATLTFSTWYDIEDGWDYAYAEASTDGGQHWQILPGKYTTDKNPAGNAFGAGWTGLSGGGDTPQWVEESVDLTPVAGKETLVRFEYVTDDAVNHPGMLVDNIAIPELGYLDDTEQGPAGWDASGWILTDNTLPQRWLVQLLEIGKNGITVQRMNVGEDGRGQFTSHDLRDLQEAVLVISAFTPVTTEQASYSYTINAR